MRVAGSRPQGPVGQVSRGLGARAPRAWGPAHQGLGAFSPQKPPNLSNYDFFANLLVGAWRRRGCRLKRLLRRWGPGGKRSRDTPPTPPWGCKGERKRVFTLSAFGNHPTRPPRSADIIQDLGLMLTDTLGNTLRKPKPCCRGGPPTLPPTCNLPTPTFQVSALHEALLNVNLLAHLPLCPASSALKLGGAASTAAEVVRRPCFI